MPYDWRLPLAQLQKRDGYFSQLRAAAELQRELHGEKALLVSHSFGGVVTFQFLQWADAREPGWAARNVHGWANVAGPLLGLPKALAPLLSGTSFFWSVCVCVCVVC